FACSYCWAVILCWSSMFLSTSLRRPSAACGCAVGSKALGLATIPASNAASQGANTDAHFGRGTCGVLSPQPVVWSGVVVESNPWTFPKYTRAADSTP